MSQFRNWNLVTLGALLLPAPGSAQPSAQPSTPLTISFGQSVGQGKAEMTRVIEESGVARVVDDSDVRILGDPWITDHLTIMSPDGEVRLGRLSTGYAERSMRAYLSRASRRQQILALEQRKSSDVQICPIDFETSKCRPPKSGEDLAHYRTAIVNRGSSPQTISVLAITKELAIISLDLGDGRTSRSLKPGETFPTHMLGQNLASTATDYAIIVTNGSAAPLSLEQSSVAVAASSACVGKQTPECTLKLPAIDPDPRWTTQFLHFQVQDEWDLPQPAVGGGISVGGGGPGWMVAIYDPQPYSQTELDKDKAKPTSQSLFLSEKSEAERAHSCGGTMISENVVLTAAHCVASGMFEGDNKRLAFKARRVRVASKMFGRGGETRAIVGMAVHEGYNGKASGQPNDIALLLIKRDDRLHYATMPLQVASQSVADRAVLDAYGWGYTEATAATSNINTAQDGGVQHNPNVLMYAPLEKIPFADCVRKLGAKMKPGMMCLGTPAERRAAGGAPTFSCRGDSGGPLVRGGGLDGEVVGVTSWSRGCGSGFPSVYTDVPYYAGWIAAARSRLVAGQAVTVPQPARVPRATRRN